MYRLLVHQSGLAFYFHLGGIPGDPCVHTRFNQYQNWYMCIKNLVIPVYSPGLTSTRNWDMYMKLVTPVYSSGITRYMNWFFTMLRYWCE